MLQEGEGQAEAHSRGCLGIGQDGAQRGEDGAARILQFLAQGEDGVAAGLADGFLKFVLGVEPPVDCAAVQARGGGRRSDGGALSQRKDDLRLAESEGR